MYVYMCGNGSVISNHVTTGAVEMRMNICRALLLENRALLREKRALREYRAPARTCVSNRADEVHMNCT